MQNTDQAKPRADFIVTTAADMDTVVSYRPDIHCVNVRDYPRGTRQCFSECGEGSGSEDC